MHEREQQEANYWLWLYLNNMASHNGKNIKYDISKILKTKKNYAEEGEGTKGNTR